jgi:hypothetical protein
MPAIAKLRRPISKRNFGPALIHSNRSGVFEKDSIDNCSSAIVRETPPVLRAQY